MVIEFFCGANQNIPAVSNHVQQELCLIELGRKPIDYFCNNIHKL